MCVCACVQVQNKLPLGLHFGQHKIAPTSFGFNGSTTCLPYWGGQRRVAVVHRLGERFFPWRPRLPPGSDACCAAVHADLAGGAACERAHPKFFTCCWMNWDGLVPVSGVGRCGSLGVHGTVTLLAGFLWVTTGFILGSPPTELPRVPS